MILGKYHLPVHVEVIVWAEGGQFERASMIVPGGYHADPVRAIERAIEDAAFDVVSRIQEPREDAVAKTVADIEARLREEKGATNA